MKKVRQLWVRRPSACLVLGCYLAAFIGALVFATGQLIYNRVLYANGTFIPKVLSADDFTFEQMEDLGEGWLTTGTDPQMLLKDPTLRVDTLRTRFGYLNPPLVQTAFYAKPGQAYSLRRMVYAKTLGESRVYTLPAAGGQSLRLDPDSAMGNILTLEEIVINEKRPFYAFYIPSATAGALLLAGPALLACALGIAFEAKRALAQRRGGKAVC